MKHNIPVRIINTRQAGFTIIELMFATLAFSTILIVITAGILSFTHAYYRGVNSSTVQDTARNIAGTISQAIEFSGTNIGPTEVDGALQYFCAGDQVFTYSLGAAYTGIPSGDPGPLDSNPGLYVMTTGDGGCPPSAPDVSSGGGQELLPPNVRVTQLNVQPASIAGATNVYTITLSLALGTNDLLCTSSVSGSCTSNASLSDTQLSTGNVACKQQTGSQFCAVSTLSTTASVRVAGSALTN